MDSFCNRKNELVSVVIPTYNYGHFICDTLEGLKNQTYPNIEVVIVDDCSHDATEKIVEEWEEQNKNVFENFVYTKLPRNCTASWAINIGFCITRGEYIVIHDADDISFEEKIEKQVNFLKENVTIAGVGTDFKGFIEDKNKEVHLSGWLSYGAEGIAKNYKERFKHCVSLGTLMIRASILESIIGFRKFIDRGNDVFFINYIINNDYLIDNIDETLLYVRVHPERKTDAYKEYIAKKKKDNKRLEDKVSVVLPVSQSGKSIIGALESIVEQTYGDIEIIIIDDATEDETEAAIKRWYYKYQEITQKKQNKELIYYKLPRKVGYPWIYNIGAYIAKGEYVVFHGVDGRSERSKIEKQVKFLKDNFMYSIIGTNWNGDDPPIQYDEDIEYSYTIDYAPCVNLFTTMVRSNVIFEIAGMSKEIDHQEDFEFIYRALNNGYRVQNLREVLYDQD